MIDNGQFPYRQPNQLELETQRTQLQLQETLNNLDATLQRMAATSEQLKVGTQLDAILDRLSQSGMTDYQVTKQFEQTQREMLGALQQQTAVQQAVLAQKGQFIGGQLSTVNSQLAMYSPEYQHALPSLVTMPEDFANTLGFRDQTNLYMYGDGLFVSGNSRMAQNAGYFSPDPLINPYYDKSAGAYASVVDQEFAWFKNIRNTAANGSAYDVADVLEFERLRQEEAQKAMLNQHISNAFGMTDKMFARSEFEGVVQPGLSSFAQDYGLALDQAAAVIKKMRDLQVISQDIQSSNSSHILNALDQTDEIFSKLSRIIKSNNVQELLNYSQHIARVGNGDFETGLGMIEDNSVSIMGGMANVTQSMEQAAAAARQFDAMFGPDSLASYNAGAWSARNQMLVHRYADGSKFRDPNMAADLYTQSTMAMANGLQGMVLSAGRGEALTGAENLIDQLKEKGATQFYLDLPEMMREAQSDMTGPYAEIYLERRLRDLKRRFRFDDDNAALAVFQDPNRVAAYKEMMHARDRRAESILNALDQARFVGSYDPGEEWQISLFDEKGAYRESDIDLEGGFWRSTGLPQWGADVFDAISRFNPRIDPGRDAKFDLSRIRRRAAVTEEIDRNFQREMTAGNADALSVIPEIASTERAQETARGIITKIAEKSYKPKIHDIQRIFIEGLVDYSSTGNLNSETGARLRSYIASLTIKQAQEDILPILGDNDPVAMVIKAAANFNVVAPQLLNPDQLASQQIVGSLAEYGIDITGHLAGQGTMAAVSEWVNENKGLVGAVVGTVGGIAVTAATGGLGAPAAFAAGAVADTLISIMAPTVVEGASEFTDWVSVTMGDEIDIEDLSEALGLTDNSVTAIEREMRGMLIFLRGLLTTWSTDVSTRAANIISQLIRRYIKGLEVTNKDKKPKESYRPLSDEQLNAIISEETQRLYKSLSSQGYLTDQADQHPEEFKAWVTSVLRAINDKNSPTGERLRAPGNLHEHANGVVSTLKTVAENIASDHLDDWYAGTAVSSVRNFYEIGGGKEFSGIFTASAASASGVVAEVQAQFANISRMIDAGTSTAEERESAQKAMDTIQNFLTRRVDELDITGEQYDALEKLLGKTQVGKLKDQLDLAEDTEDKRKKAALWFAEAGQQANTEAQRLDDESAQIVRTFMKVAMMITSDPNASELSRQLYRTMTG